MNKEAKMAGRKGFIKGIVVGGLIGSAAALLFAPKSGKETQEDIKRKARLVKHDIDTTIDQMQQDLVGRIDNLKDVAKELGNEAKQESAGLIKRAELLKTDLAKSATTLTKGSSDVRDEAVASAKLLLEEGSGIMGELERVTKKMVSSAKDKMKKENGEV
jgi:gas vesicle protein